MNKNSFAYNFHKIAREEQEKKKKELEADRVKKYKERRKEK